MQKIDSASPEANSKDLLKDNTSQLRAIFPEVFVENKIDFEVLRDLLSETISEPSDEKYGLDWPGKRSARRASLIPSTGTLRPLQEDSVGWDDTRNILIEGDNLEVLKLLQKSYHAQIKMIYIDPPYNTGNDFIYPDDFSETLATYLKYTGQVDEEGHKFSTNTESNGRFHSKWLNMMYPRLRLARNLLRDDGVIFISIADHEVHNLRIICNEIFGQENFIASVIWQKVFAPKNSARHFSEDHDYILVYARNAEIWRPNLLPRSDEMESRYGNPDNDPRGNWASDNLTARNYYSAGTYSVTCPSGRVIDGPPSGTYWRFSKEKFEELDKDNRIWWGADGNNMPRLKRFLSEVKAGRVPQTLWTFKEVGHTQEAKKELIASVKFPSSDSVLETPKPTRLVRRMLQLATNVGDEDIVLDFFAGSGTTMHAVFAQNADDNGNRRTILVQLPEPIPTAKEGDSLQVLTDITKERLRTAGNSLSSENPSFTGDFGFRVFKLDASNIKAWEPNPDNLRQTLLDNIENLDLSRSETDILFELLLKWGLDLTIPIEQHDVANKKVFSIGFGALLVCLEREIYTNDVENLALGLVRLREELAPVGETTCIFRDTAFADDVAKTNLSSILIQHGLENVRSI